MCFCAAKVSLVYNLLGSLRKRFVSSGIGVWRSAGPRHLFESSRDYKVMSGTCLTFYWKYDWD